MRPFTYEELDAIGIPFKLINRYNNSDPEIHAEAEYQIFKILMNRIREKFTLDELLGATVETVYKRILDESEEAKLLDKVWPVIMTKGEDGEEVELDDLVCTLQRIAVWEMVRNDYTEDGKSLPADYFDGYYSKLIVEHGCVERAYENRYFKEYYNL